MTKVAEDLALRELATRLRAIVDGRLDTETSISKKTGVDQPTISNAKRGKLKRVTQRILPLISYADIRLSDEVRESKASELARRFYEAGGTELELQASIEHAIALLTGKLRRRSD
jgi:hypothetical protein